MDPRICLLQVTWLLITDKLLRFALQSEFEIVVKTPDGTSLAGTDLVLQNIEREAWKLRGVKHVLSTINGGGTYKFILTAIDGQLNGGGGSDKFRIKIWDPTVTNSAAAVIYDNMLGVTDDADPTTVIAGGSIVIHK